MVLLLSTTIQVSATHKIQKKKQGASLLLFLQSLMLLLMSLITFIFIIITCYCMLFQAVTTSGQSVLILLYS